MSKACRKFVACAQIALKGAGSRNRNKIMRKGLGSERFSQISRIPERQWSKLREREKPLIH